MLPDSVVLVGPMGSGKSTVGRALADRLGLSHTDTDEIVVEASGRTIPEIFKSEGEAGFRALEHEALCRALAGGTGVISTGGGMVTSEDNRLTLGQCKALVVWLDAPIEVLMDRLGDGAGRPLLAGDDVEGALRIKIAERADAYDQVADFRLDTSDLSPEDCVDFIVAERAARAQKVGRATPCR